MLTGNSVTKWTQDDNNNTKEHVYLVDEKSSVKYTNRHSSNVVPVNYRDKRLSERELYLTGAAGPAPSEVPRAAVLDGVNVGKALISDIQNKKPFKIFMMEYLTSKIHPNQ